ncbi:MAG: hypothetical protein ACU85E_16145 [Gammaproteobacteria bacterium]
MSRVLRLKKANQKAEALLKEWDIDQLPIDPFAIAAKRDIIVEAKQDSRPRGLRRS